jgi:4-carboxymuconolactone decarboxylase
MNDPVFPDRLAQDYRRAGLDDRLMAVMDYVIKITRASVETSEDDIAHLRSHGLTDDDIYDVIQTAAIYNFNNRVASASGFIPDRRHHTAFRG